MHTYVITTRIYRTNNCVSGGEEKILFEIEVVQILFEIEVVQILMLYHYSSLFTLFSFLATTSHAEVVLRGGICSSDMSRLESVAKSNSAGKSPDGRCYSHVSDYIDQSGYGTF